MNTFTSKQHTKVHFGSALEPGASRLPYCCKRPVCVPNVIGALWRQNINKKNGGDVGWAVPGGDGDGIWVIK